jgi:hypothetical protein
MPQQTENKSAINKIIIGSKVGEHNSNGKTPVV